MDEQLPLHHAIRGTAWFLLSFLLGILTQAGTALVAYRLVGPIGVGRWVLPSVVLAVLATACDAGLTLFLVREPDALSRRFLAGIGGVFLVAVVVAPLAISASDASSWAAVAVCAPILTSQVFARAALLRRGRFRDVAGVEVVAGVAAMLVAVTGAELHFGTAAFACAAVVRVTVSFKLSSRLERNSRKPGMGETQGVATLDAVRRASVLMIASAISSVGSNVDYLVLALYLDVKPLAVYFLAFNLTLSIVSSIANSVARTVTPLRSARDQDEFVEIVSRLSATVGGLAGVLGLAIHLAAPLLQRFFGSEWPGLGLSMEYLAVAAAAVALRTMAGIGLVAIRKDFTVGTVTLITLTTTWLAVVAFAPGSATSAAAATAVGFSAGGFVAFSIFRMFAGAAANAAWLLSGLAAASALTNALWPHSRGALTVTTLLMFSCGAAVVARDGRLVRRLVRAGR